MTGTIKGFEVTTNRNSDQKVLMLQVEISGPDDIQSVQWYNSGGVQSIPLIESKVQILQNGSGWKIAVSANDGIDFDSNLKEGEKKIYNKDQSGTLIMKADGSIEINGDSKRFVTHAELDTALQTFMNALNLHTHPTAATGSPSPPTAPMSLDISSSETTTVKTGG